MRTLRVPAALAAGASLARSVGSEASALVLWLGADGIRRLAPQPLAASDAPVFLSSTLLGASWEDLPAALRGRARVVHLSALPGQRDRSLERFRAWAQARGVRLREQRHQALAYFAALAFAEGTKHMARFVARDYLVDLLDHASGLAVYLPLYPRAGITPGQRVLSRGGYVIDVSGRSEPRWIVP